MALLFIQNQKQHKSKLKEVYLQSNKSNETQERI